MKLLNNNNAQYTKLKKLIFLTILLKSKMQETRLWMQHQMSYGVLTVIVSLWERWFFMFYCNFKHFQSLALCRHAHLRDKSTLIENLMSKKKTTNDFSSTNSVHATLKLKMKHSIQVRTKMMRLEALVQIWIQADHKN